MRCVGSSAGRIALGLLVLVSIVAVLAAFAPAPPTDPTEPVATLVPAPAATAAAGNKFIGASKCANCHKAEAVGNQMGKWTESKHSKAFEALASDRAKEIAKEKGIEDPQKSDACLKCHVTGHGKPAEELATGFKAEMGVQCESCHGPGDQHMKDRVKAAAKAKDGAPAPVAEGEIVGHPKMDNCVTCHNAESPTYKPFCFKEYAEKIAHLNPSKTRTPEELAALRSCTCEKCKGG